MSPHSPLYRPNVGIALFNTTGLVLIGHRFKNDGPEIILPGFEWQMPQGGIDIGENPYQAAVRELFEETGVTNFEYLTQINDWLTYEFPPYAGLPHRLSPFHGQRQKWFALRFTGDESEIDVSNPHANQQPEFDAWRWERLDQVTSLVVPFKKELYQQVTKAFSSFA